MYAALLLFWDETKAGDCQLNDCVWVSLNEQIHVPYSKTRMQTCRRTRAHTLSLSLFKNLNN